MEQYRIERLKRHQREHTLIRGAWTETDEQGRELACLLFALAPEIGPRGAISACPSSVMPLWLAYLTPWIDDAPSDAMWGELITRYVGLASQWHVLDEEDWKRLDYAVRAVCLREAMQHTQDEKTLGVCRRVLDLCDEEAQGERVDEKTWADAAEASEMRMRKARAEVEAEEAAAWAAEAAWAVTARIVEAAESAARAAMEAAAVASTGAARTAMTTAADRVVAGILDTIEQAVNQKT